MISGEIKVNQLAKIRSMLEAKFSDDPFGSAYIGIQHLSVIIDDQMKYLIFKKLSAHFMPLIS